MIQIYNTLSAKKELFEPFKNKKVNLFVCGPTVYDFSHIGHIRTYVIFDVFVKYLRYKGYKVNFVLNITDIDDRIIDRAKQENKPWEDIAKLYETSFLEDIKNLNINSINKIARATDHIKEIIKQIQTLLDKGYAYKIEEGIYFDISKFEGYGKLSKRTVQQAEDAVSRVDESVSKRNKGDFVLWRISESGKPGWSSSFGFGRPGWHIEDTAITEKYLGQQYDIHGGGQDLIFPHHEAEITQQEAASGKKPFVKYWLHSGLVTINGQKMSKSLKNTITIQNILKKYSSESLRFMAINAHYRSPVEYRENLLKQSEAAVQRIFELDWKLTPGNLDLPKETEITRVQELIEEYKEKIESALDNDFNTPLALSELFNFIKEINKLLSSGLISKKQAVEIKKLLNWIGRDILGVLPDEWLKITDILQLVEKRETLRKEKAWLEADKARDEIQALGYSIEDTPYGPLVKLKSKS